jgi:DNA-binding NarL/FixJ family response regulator
MTKVLLVDDHGVVRHGIRRILEDFFQDPALIHEASTGQQAINMVQGGNYLLVVLDISLPDRNGLDVLQQIRLFKPGTNVIVLSMHSEEEFALRSLKAGAQGYLTKMSASEELISAIETVLDGKQYISPRVAELLIQELRDDKTSAPLHKFLSNRELQVACMIAGGKTPTEIAQTLCLSVKTVSTYRTRILEKLHLKTNADLVIYCHDHHLSL